MDLVSAAILGVVEGLTEFLPVSSTGHLTLAGRLMNLADTEFFKSFEVAIQLGAILAVVLLYFRTLLVKPAMIAKVAVGFLPTAVIGLLAYKLVKQHLLGNSTVVLWALLLGGIGLIVFEWIYRRRSVQQPLASDITFTQAFVVGIFQSLAIVPGVSRSAATIIGGLCLGLSRTAAAEFSFLLAVPTMGAAVALDFSRSAVHFTPDEFAALGTGFLVSFIVAVVAVKGFIHYLQKHDFVAFGVYRIALAAMLFWIWR